MVPLGMKAPASLPVRLGGHRFEFPDRLVAVARVVAEGGLAHGFEHGLGGAGEGVASEIDHVLNPEMNSKDANKSNTINRTAKTAKTAKKIKSIQRAAKRQSASSQKPAPLAARVMYFGSCASRPANSRMLATPTECGK